MLSLGRKLDTLENFTHAATVVLRERGKNMATENALFCQHIFAMVADLDLDLDLLLEF